MFKRAAVTRYHSYYRTDSQVPAIALFSLCLLLGLLASGVGLKHLRQSSQLDTDGAAVQGTIASIRRYDKYRSTVLVSYKDFAGNLWERRFVRPNNQVAVGQAVALRYVRSDPETVELAATPLSANVSAERRLLVIGVVGAMIGLFGVVRFALAAYHAPQGDAETR